MTLRSLQDGAHGQRRGLSLHCSSTPACRCCYRGLYRTTHTGHRISLPGMAASGEQPMPNYLSAWGSTKTKPHRCGDRKTGLYRHTFLTDASLCISKAVLLSAAFLVQEETLTTVKNTNRRLVKVKTNNIGVPCDLPVCRLKQVFRPKHPAKPTSRVLMCKSTPVR